MKVAMEKLMRTKRVTTPWKIGTAYQCFSRMYHLTHLKFLSDSILMGYLSLMIHRTYGK